jgi:hypothetical protein
MNHSILPSDRKFAYSMSVIFIAIALYFLIAETFLIVTVASLILGVCFLLFGVLKPTSLNGLNKFWLKVGLLMGRVISPIILSLIFLFLISPVALITRLFGRDELELRPKNLCFKSHWKIRPREEYSEQYFQRQF